MRDSLATHPAFGRDADAVPHRAATSLPVRDIMSHPPVHIDVGATLGEAQAAMLEVRFHHLLVYDAERFVGVLSDRDLLAHVSPNLGTLAERRGETDTLKRRVFHATSYAPVTATPDASASEAATLMLHHGISCLPISSATGRIIGVVTTHDLIHLLVH
jgi:acetoin utilization protein AcuB